jgi:F0F1-type ATP synthase epsilon subunit
MNKKTLLLLSVLSCAYSTQSVVAMSPNTYGTMPFKYVYYYGAGALALAGAVGSVLFNIDAKQKTPIASDFRDAFVSDACNTVTGTMCSWFANPKSNQERFINLYNVANSIQKGFAFIGAPAAAVSSFYAWQRSTTRALRFLKEQKTSVATNNGYLNDYEVAILKQTLETAKKHGEKEELKQAIAEATSHLNQTTVEKIKAHSNSQPWPLVTEAVILHNNVEILESLSTVSGSSVEFGLNWSAKLAQFRTELQNVHANKKYKEQLQDKLKVEKEQADILSKNAATLARLQASNAKRDKAEADRRRSDAALLNAGVNVYNAATGRPNQIQVDITTHQHQRRYY